MTHRTLLPRSAPAAVGVSSRAIGALLDRLGDRSIECHSLMVVRNGRIAAEGWWEPYSAERPHLLYSLTKSFTSVAVGLAIDDGVLSLEDRVVDLLPDHVPGEMSDRRGRDRRQRRARLVSGLGDSPVSSCSSPRFTPVAGGYEVRR